MLTLLTKLPQSLIDYIKETIRPARGPQMVAASLQKGLDELNFSYILNPKYLTDTVAVLQNPKALRFAIEQKKQGKIKQLLAGPNIVVTPKEADAIYEHPLIDKIILPCEWTKNFYCSLSPVIKDKIFLWPAGVDDPGEPIPIKERDTILIYQKNAPNDLLNKVIQKLKIKNYKIDIITYGKYKQADYFNKLKQTKLVIFLTQSESQGIAQQEAWMRDVPTLVWNPGKIKYKEHTISDKKLASPYLTDDCGKFFVSIGEFDMKLNEIINNLASYKPRQYALANFTHKISAEKYLNIINQK